MNASLPQQTGLAALDDDGRREYWAALALRHTAGLGVRGACLLLRHFGSAYEAVTNVPAWPEAGVPAQKAEGYLNNAWRAAARPEWDAAHTLRASIILWTDKRYPPLLRELPDAPALLYAAGDASLLRAPCVAIVGSRAASAATTDSPAAVAEELSGLSATELADVVDGLEEEMAAASEAMDFETAARIRDQIVAIRTRVEGGSAEDVIARLKAGARKGSVHATRRRRR